MKFDWAHFKKENAWIEPNLVELSSRSIRLRSFYIKFGWALFRMDERLRLSNLVEIKKQAKLIKIGWAQINKDDWRSESSMVELSWARIRGEAGLTFGRCARDSGSARSESGERGFALLGNAKEIFKSAKVSQMGIVELFFPKKTQIATDPNISLKLAEWIITVRRYW